MIQYSYLLSGTRPNSAAYIIDALQSSLSFTCMHYRSSHFTKIRSRTPWKLNWKCKIAFHNLWLTWVGCSDFPQPLAAATQTSIDAAFLQTSTVKLYQTPPILKLVFLCRLSAVFRGLTEKQTSFDDICRRRSSITQLAKFIDHIGTIDQWCAVRLRTTLAPPTHLSSQSANSTWPASWTHRENTSPSQYTVELMRWE